MMLRWSFEMTAMHQEALTVLKLELTWNMGTHKRESCQPPIHALEEQDQAKGTLRELAVVLEMELTTPQRLQTGFHNHLCRSN